MIRSRAKLGLRDGHRRPTCRTGSPNCRAASRAARTSAAPTRSDPPEQEVVPDDGCYDLRFQPAAAGGGPECRARRWPTNLAVADALLKAHTGLFRVDARARGLGVRSGCATPPRRSASTGPRAAKRSEMERDARSGGPASGRADSRHPPRQPWRKLRALSGGRHPVACRHGRDLRPRHGPACAASPTATW